MVQLQPKYTRKLIQGMAIGGFLATTAIAPMSVAFAAGEKPDPVELLGSMSEALKNATYRGTFVHMANGHVESMRLLHANDGESVRERMTSLNGEAREVYRNNSLVTCIWPGSRSVIVSKSKPRDLIPRIGVGLTGSESYTFVAEADDRVAGIDAHVVSVIPKDNFRYGYRFWIDKNTHVMLRSMLLDSDENSLEEMMFTEISYPDKIPESELEANAESRGGYSWVEPSGEQLASSGEDKVSFASLPAGYKELSESYEPMPMSDSAVSHVMLSDGVASVSVYVEYTPGGGGPVESGMSKMGAMNAYGRSMDTAFITVVGEVPAETVQFIGDSVKFVGDN